MAQCPNCGGYKVGYQHPGGGCYPWMGIFLGISFIFLVIQKLPSLDSLGFAVGLILLGGLGVFFLVGGILTLFPTQTHLLECHLCGYQWDSRTNPKVTVRPNLIIKGEERLRAEAEAEEERKRQEAAWWLQQQRKK